jgi:hypothetical protein
MLSGSLDSFSFRTAVSHAMASEGTASVRSAMESVLPLAHPSADLVSQSRGEYRQDEAVRVNSDQPAALDRVMARNS